MRAIVKWILAPALALLVAGCSNGVLLNSGLYSHTVEPLTFNRQPTEVLEGMDRASGGVSHIQFRAGILWGTNGIGEVARKHGMKTVFYADIERLRVFFGIWRRDIVHVYGR
jgi:hypothetical protein